MLNPTFLKLHKTPILLAFLSMILYWIFGYDLARTEQIKLLSIYAGLFVLFYVLVKNQK